MVFRLFAFLTFYIIYSSRTQMESTAKDLSQHSLPESALLTDTSHQLQQLRHQTLPTCGLDKYSSLGIIRRSNFANPWAIRLTDRGKKIANEYYVYD